MRVLICGDRNWKDQAIIERCITALPPDTVVIEGDALGADKIAGRLASDRGLEVLIFPADWYQYHKGAGPIRNLQMLREGRPNLVIYFHNNLKESKGTRHMVKISSDKGIPVLNGKSVSDWPRAIDWYLKGGDKDN